MTTLQEAARKALACLELYDHEVDPGNNPDVSENQNGAASADRTLLEQLHTQLVAGFPPRPAPTPAPILAPAPVPAPA